MTLILILLLRNRERIKQLASRPWGGRVERNHEVGAQRAWHTCFILTYPSPSLPSPITPQMLYGLLLWWGNKLISLTMNREWLSGHCGPSPPVLYVSVHGHLAFMCFTFYLPCKNYSHPAVSCQRPTAASQALRFQRTLHPVLPRHDTFLARNRFKIWGTLLNISVPHFVLP